MFKHQGEFFDIPIQDLSPRQVRDKLAQLASVVLPPDAVEKFKGLLALEGTPNGGNAVTDDLKYTSTFRLSCIEKVPCLDGVYQSNSPGRMAFTFLPLCFGMVSSKARLQVLGIRKNGRISSLKKFLPIR